MTAIMRSCKARVTGVRLGRFLCQEPIYVEVRIRASMDELWRRTQVPDLHTKWDLRFSAIEYLPRSDPDEPQRFRYTRRLGLLTISGEGVTVGNQESSGRRTSALQFGSDDRRSLIERGSGYWQYLQTEDGIRFLTRYSYEPRWGRLGRWIDGLIFRRLLGWATAWSFDRLRLWLECDLDPSVALRRSFVHAAVRVSLASLWLYRGLGPKLHSRDSDERDVTRGARNDRPVDWAEVALGAGTLALWTRREVLPVSGALLALRAGGSRPSEAPLRHGPFNGWSFTWLAASLSLAGFLAARLLPTSRTCLRVSPRSRT